MRSIDKAFTGLLLLAAALAAPASVLAQGAKCDRACLTDALTRYLDSIVVHDPKKAPLAAGARFTEDGQQLAVGEGLWKTASKVRPNRRDYLDERDGTAAVHAVVEENGSPVLFAARLKLVNRKIAEIETMVVRNVQEGVLFAPDELSKPSPMLDLPPKSALMPREQMIEMALRYPGGLRVGSFEKSNAVFGTDAYRFENGVRMAGKGCTFRPPSCEDLRSQQLPTLAAIKADVVAVDKRSGAVLLYMNFGAGSLPGPQSAGKALVTFEAFKIYGGAIHAVEAVLEGAPEGAPRGW
jgi:hypothetical protein